MGREEGGLEVSSLRFLRSRFHVYYFFNRLSDDVFSAVWIEYARPFSRLKCLKKFDPRHFSIQD